MDSMNPVPNCITWNTHLVRDDQQTQNMLVSPLCVRNIGITILILYGARMIIISIVKVKIYFIIK